MYAEITSAIQSAKVLSDLLKSAKSLANYNELVAALSEVNTKLMDATAVALGSQEAQSKLHARVAELERELSRVAGWEEQVSRYALHELATGQFVFALRPALANQEPPHFLCSNCFTRHQKAILQLRNQNEFGRWYVCHNCKSEIHVDSGYRSPV